LLQPIKTELLASETITDKSVLSMLTRIINNRYPSIFSNEVNIETQNGNFHVNQNIEKKLKGFVVYTSKDKIDYNLASAITDISDPLKGFANIREIYTVVLKGVLLKIINRNSSIMFNSIMTPSATLFLDLMQDVVFKADRNKFTGVGSRLNLAMIILNYFYSSVVKLNTDQAKRETENLLRIMFKNDVEEITNSFLVSKQYMFSDISLQDMCLIINETFGTQINEKMFHSYFLAQHNFVYQGLTDYKEFIAGIYPIAKIGSFSGKLLMTKFSVDVENFVKAIERNITVK